MSLSINQQSWSQLVRITNGPVEIEGMLQIPHAPTGLVLFAHGSGSSRLSPRNDYVVALLREAGIATLLIDLLTPQEDQDCRTRFNIHLLTQRLYAQTVWLSRHSDTRSLPIGLFGANTGAAAAFQVATMAGTEIGAVVSRGGRPDLAHRSALEKFSLPALFIVGGLDDIVIELNEETYATLKCEKQLVVVPGATHHFEESGKLEIVASLARDWFLQHLVKPGTGAATA